MFKKVVILLICKNRDLVICLYNSDSVIHLYTEILLFDCLQVVRAMYKTKLVFAMPTKNDVKV